MAGTTHHELRLLAGRRAGAVGSAAACLAGFFPAGSLTGVQLSVCALLGRFAAVFVAPLEAVARVLFFAVPFEDAAARVFFLGVAPAERVFLAPFDVAVPADFAVLAFERVFERVGVFLWVAIAY
jgi:hypothetical protein